MDVHASALDQGLDRAGAPTGAQVPRREISLAGVGLHHRLALAVEHLRHVDAYELVVGKARERPPLAPGSPM
jgi:hypothetical protein